MQRPSLTKVISSGVGMAAEYREHRKAQKQERERVHELPGDEPPPFSPGEDAAPPAYAAMPNHATERSLGAAATVATDNKELYDDNDDDDDESISSDEDDSDDDFQSIEDDEQDWALDEAAADAAATAPPLPQHADDDTLVRDVVERNAQSLGPEVVASARPPPGPSQPTPAVLRSPLPCPVVIPQRRPRSKARGFVRAYAPLLGSCSGISQEAFLAFIDNFHKSSQASPIFLTIKMAAGIASVAPSLIALAVTTTIQVSAQIGSEVQSRMRTNTFLDKCNAELFKPAGLYAMIVKYQSDEDVSASKDGLLARLGVSGQTVDFSTNATIATYDRAAPGAGAEEVGEVEGKKGGGGMSQRMQDLRVASGTTQGSTYLPEAAPLVFPDVDRMLAGEKAGDGKEKESLRRRMEDAGEFLQDYMDRRAQANYASTDPNTPLTLPASARSFRSPLADPNHPMHNSGLIGLVSGGKLAGLSRQYDPTSSTPSFSAAHPSAAVGTQETEAESRFARRARRAAKYERRLARGGELGGKRLRRYERFVAEAEARSASAGPQGTAGGPSAATAGRGGHPFAGRGRGGPPPFARGRGGAFGGGPPPWVRARFGDGPPPWARGGRGGPFGGGPPPWARGGRGPFGRRSRGGGLLGSLIGAAIGSASGSRSREYGDDAPAYEETRMDRRSLDARGEAERGPHAAHAEGHGADAGGAEYYAGGGRRERTPGVIGRMMREDVLYLLIVNMPSEEELAEAREVLARAKGGR